jgi:hypothetical protein
LSLLTCGGPSERPKFTALASLGHEIFSHLANLLDSCSRLRLGLFSRFALFSSESRNLDWNIHNLWGTRWILWAYARGDLGFFRVKELQEANVPRLAIEYDPHDSDQYTPQLQILTQAVAPVSPQPEILQVYRRFLKVNIRNDGTVVAERCKATLRLIRFPKGVVHPSTEPKPLRWDSGVKRADVGANGGRELLHVVLSHSEILPDSRKTQSFFAFVSTPDTVRIVRPPFRAQDLMGIGDFEFQLVVQAKTGQSISGVFRVHVTENWEDLAMERIA